MSAVMDTNIDRHAPPWAKSCKNPYIRHDWDWIPNQYEPGIDFNTIFDCAFFFNERCTECKLVCARMIAEDGTRTTRYDEKTRPKDYKYTEVEEPTMFQYARWRAEVGEERHRRRNTRRTRSQRGKQIAAA